MLIRNCNSTIAIFSEVHNLRASLPQFWHFFLWKIGQFMKKNQRSKISCYCSFKGTVVWKMTLGFYYIVRFVFPQGIIGLKWKILDFCHHLGFYRKHVHFTKKVTFLNMWQNGVHFIARIHVFISFEFVKRWSTIFDNVTTRYEFRTCSKVKWIIYRADLFFMARHDFAIHPKKTRSKAKFCILTECLKNLTAQCNCDQTMLQNSY